MNSNSYILGNEVKKFEKNFSKYLGVKYSLGVSNGTDALILALKAIDIKQGDEVITTSYCFCYDCCDKRSWSNSVFIDIKEDDFTIDTKYLGKKITKKTKAIIVVHIYGNPADILTIQKIAKKKLIL